MCAGWFGLCILCVLLVSMCSFVSSPWCSIKVLTGPLPVVLVFSCQTHFFRGFSGWSATLLFASNNVRFARGEVQMV